MPLHFNPWRPAIFDHPLPRRVFPGRTPWDILMRKLLTFLIALAAIAAVNLSAPSRAAGEIYLTLCGEERESFAVTYNSGAGDAAPVIADANPAGADSIIKIKTPSTSPAGGAQF